LDRSSSSNVGMATSSKNATRLGIDQQCVASG
jgi:hypothetical protein